MRASLPLPSLATLDLTPAESAVYRSLHELRGMFRTHGVTAGFIAHQAGQHVVLVLEALDTLRRRGLAVRVNGTLATATGVIPVNRWKEGRCRG